MLHPRQNQENDCGKHAHPAKDFQISKLEHFQVVGLESVLEQRIEVIEEHPLKC